MNTEFEQKKDPITLTRMILRDSKAIGASGDFAILMNSIQLAIKVIASATSKAGIINLHGIYAGGGNNNNQSSPVQGLNSTGDVQKKLDILANDVFINALSFSDQVRILGSEENEEPYLIRGSTGKYSVVFDPLDGSSNIDCNGAIGTIFGIYNNETFSEEQIATDPQQLILQKGTKLVAAGFVVYGPATTFVFATEHSGVNEYTLDTSIGEFIVTNENIRVPTQGKIYSTNTGNRKLWDKAMLEYIDLCDDRKYSGRYVGSFVADITRTLSYGGIFIYPSTTNASNGKLRLLYECNPMAFILERAGGKATTGPTNKRILDIQPTHVHQRVPIFLGSAEMVDEVGKIYDKHFTNNTNQ